MNSKVLDTTARGAIVVLLLILIWLLFAPKTYGQSVYAKKQDSCAPKYRWATENLQYKQVADFMFKTDSSVLIMKPDGRIYLRRDGQLTQIKDRDPVKVKIGTDTFIVWRKKIYQQLKAN